MRCRRRDCIARTDASTTLRVACEVWDVKASGKPQNVACRPFFPHVGTGAARCVWPSHVAGNPVPATCPSVDFTYSCAIRRLEERAPLAEERAPSRGEVLEVSSAAKDVERETLRIRHASRLQWPPLLPQREQDICSKKHHYHHSAIGRFGLKSPPYKEQKRHLYLI